MMNMIIGTFVADFATNIIHIRSFKRQDVARPPNDSCENAVAIISNDTPMGYNTIGAFSDFTVPLTCSVNDEVRGVWFKFTPLNDRIVTVKTSAGTFPHRIAIFTGATCGNIGCFRNIGSGSYITLPITWDAKAGQQYYILVTGSSDFSHVGTFTIAITVCIAVLVILRKICRRYLMYLIEYLVTESMTGHSTTKKR